ncbi:MAG: hypothetical protein QM489_01030 [Candidatus Izemoplasma sp.]
MINSIKFNGITLSGLTHKIKIPAGIDPFIMIYSSVTSNGVVVTGTTIGTRINAELYSPHLDETFALVSANDAGLSLSRVDGVVVDADLASIYRLPFENSEYVLTFSDDRAQDVDIEIVSSATTNTQLKGK